MIPSPQKATRPAPAPGGARCAAMSSCSLAISATSGRLDPQPVSRLEGARRLRLQLRPVQQVPTRRALLAARRSGRRVSAALRDERVAHLGERLQLADDAVAAAPAPGAARAAPERVLDRTQRELELQRLDRRVERVR